MRTWLITALTTVAIVVGFAPASHAVGKQDKPNIVILATGGTIAGSGEATGHGYTSGQFNVDDLIKAVPDLDTIFVPVGAGSGVLGTAIVARAVNPAIKVIGVQSAGAPAVYRSWREGRRIETEVIATLRSLRGLKPGQENNFSIVTQDKLLDSWNQVTGMFFLVMLVLSSIGLMVGGVGVVAIMMISVTERTREIGVRKALGATRRAILWQFLVEASTLTLVGGAVGMLGGGVLAFAVSRLTPVPAHVPLWSIIAALAASALTGIGFGLYPASRASRLDPVEALRYE